MRACPGADDVSEEQPAALIEEQAMSKKRMSDEFFDFGSGEGRLSFWFLSRAVLDHDGHRALSVHDLHSIRAVSKSVWRRLEEGMEYVRARGQRSSNVPVVRYPGFPGLFPPPPKKEGPVAPRGLFLHQLASVEAMRRAECANLEYGSLRGGVLADAPGLGKTVSCFALILATAGELPKEPAAFFDKKSVNESWAALAQSGQFEIGPQLLRGLHPLLNHRDDLPMNSKPWKQANALLRACQPPFEFATPNALESFVRSRLSRLDATTPAVRDAIRSELSQAVALIKATIDKRSRSRLQGAAGKRMLAERTLKSTGATLILVPDALLEHWRSQLERHLDLNMLASSFGDGKSGQGVFYIDGAGDGAQYLEKKRRRDNGDLVHRLESRLQPFNLYGPLPSAEELRQYLIVVVPFSRCTSAAVDQARRLREGGSNFYRHGKQHDSAESSLLGLRWLRLIVDEGHDLSHEHDVEPLDTEVKKRSKTEPASRKTKERPQLDAATTKFISELFAERRWVVSGTPTTGDVDAEGATKRELVQLQHLLKWLRHPEFGLDVDPRLDGNQASKKAAAAAKEAFQAQIVRPFLGDDKTAALVARGRLVEVLRSVFVRHRKEDIELPKPVFANVEMEVQRDSGSTDEEFDWAVDTALGDHIVETLKKEPKAKAAVFSQFDADLASVAEVLYAKLGASNIAEFNVRRLGASASSRELVRFEQDATLFKTCPVCGAQNDATVKHCEKILMEVAFLDDDLVAARKQAFDLDVEGQFEMTPQQHELLSRERARRVLIEPERIVSVDRVLDAATYQKNHREWQVDDLFEITTRDAGFKQREPYSTWRESWGARGCERTALRDGFESSNWFFGPLLLPSGSRRVKLLKWAKCGRWHHSRWFTGPKYEKAPTEVQEERVPVLCLYRDASHGLDLSYLTRIFLLEPLNNDAALLEQVVSRAHRVGATRPVQVETLVALKTEKHSDDETTKDETTKDETTKDKKKQEKQTYICDFCYKSFLSDPEAETHMLKCSRNPGCLVKRDAFSIASIFDEIKPPPPSRRRAPPINKQHE